MSRCVVMLVTLLCSAAAMAVELPGIPGFIDEMVAKHQFKREELERVFSIAQHRPDVIAAMEQPATLKPWPEYRALFVNRSRIEGGIKFWRDNAATLRRAADEFGVPPEIIVAVIGVETLYGRNAGRYRTLDALTTLAFDYPRRAAFFRAELENYLLLARDLGFDLLSVQSSYAGALGIPQFMPSSYRRYALDYNGNGRADLLNEPEDVIGSVANYLKGYGWQRGQPVAVRARVVTAENLPVDKQARHMAAWKAAGVEAEAAEGPLPAAVLLDFTVETGKEYWLAFENFRVITRYNNSVFYAMTVHQLAQEMRRALRS